MNWDAAGISGTARCRPCPGDQLLPGDYLIQLTDGRRLRSPRGQLALRKAYQRNLAVEAGTAAVDGPDLVARHTIYAASG